MAHEARVTVNVQSPACDVCCFDFMENEYIDITCDESYYALLWDRLKNDPILAHKLEGIQQRPPVIRFWPGMEYAIQPQMTRASILGSIVLNIVVYAALAGIAYCVYVGAKTLLQ